MKIVKRRGGVRIGSEVWRLGKIGSPEGGERSLREREDETRVWAFPWREELLETKET